MKKYSNKILVGTIWNQYLSTVPSMQFRKVSCFQGEKSCRKTKRRVFSKAFAALALSLCGVFFASSVHGQSAAEECDPCPDGSLKVAGMECPDPAFLGVDRKPLESLSVRRVKKANLPDHSEVNSLHASELSIWEEFEIRLQNDPQSAFQAAMEIWSGNYSDSLQRVAIYQARNLVRSTDEIENLNFMLSCLEDAKAQKAKCLSLGKSNGLERKIGASRLALLTSNPKFSDL